jgi:molybdopterin molybdotransferase
MAQLTDDCFAFAGPLLPLDEMERLIVERVASVAECEEVPLRAALGRVLSADVIAAVDLPPFDNSAVDGFAVRSKDLDPQAETKLLVVDRVAAGHAPLRPLGARWRGHAHLHRRADAGRRRHRVHAGGHSPRG